MADRYWVGGTGSWDATTTHWSASSGGAGGASVPTSVDDVYFDSASNATAYTVTLITTPVCASVSVVGPATGNVTIGGSVTWSIYGSLFIASSGVNWANGSTINFRATTTGWTITTNGATLINGIIFNGAGGGWTLGSALTSASTGGITVTQGAFATANFNVTINGSFTSTGALTRSLTLGSSAISCLTWNAAGATNLTLNAGTSTITITQTAGNFAGGGLTYYNVYKAQNGFIIGDSGNTFNALTNTTASAGASFVYVCSFAGNQTIGTLTINGGSAAWARISIQTPNTLAGTQITLTVGSFVSNGFVDFRDINLQGTASPLTVSTGGDCGNNANITLATPKTVYWNLVGGGTWNLSTAWALTSGGTPAVGNYPLPQDTAIFQDTGLNSGAIITLSGFAVGTIDASTRTLPMSFAGSSSFLQNIYGDFKLSSAVTSTSVAANPTFLGYSKTQTIASAGVSIGGSITISNPTVTVTLADAVTSTGTAGFTLTSGTLNLANNNLTCGVFNTNNSNTRTLAFGTGQIYLTGNNATIWAAASVSNFSYTGTPIINCNYSGSVGTRTVNAGSSFGNETNALTFNVTAGSDIFTFATSSYIKSLNLTGFSGTFSNVSFTLFGNLIVPSGVTLTAGANTVIFSSTLTQQNITSNSITFDFPLLFNGTNSYQLQDALTVGSTKAITLTKGTLDLNGKSLSIGLFSSTGSNVRSIAFNGGTMVVSGATFTASGSNLTTSGTSTISMTSASSKTFAGGGLTYSTLSQDGTGTLTITDAGTFNNITNTATPSTITFPAGLTTTVGAFNVNGVPGSLVTINSNTPGSQATLVYSGNSTYGINSKYLSIQDSAATPANTWYAGANSTNVSNNTGWIFTSAPTVLIGRLNNTGNFSIPNSSVFDEVSLSTFKTAESSTYSAGLDEIAAIAVLLRVNNNGNIQISGIFDEVSGMN